MHPKVGPEVGRAWGRIHDAALQTNWNRVWTIEEAAAAAAFDVPSCALPYICGLRLATDFSGF